MRRVLRRLLRRGKKYGKEDDEPPPPPLPSLQDADADREAWTPDQQRQSLFFCLPAEIRHMILCAAFGDRTVHIDLRLRPRLYTAKTAEGCSPSRFHAGYPPLLTRWDMELRHGVDVRTEDDKKLAWRWYGCVCHHNQPGGAYNHAYNDACLSGFARGCSSYPGNVPEKCMVGAIGYLLSCKRAHREGCLILYQTNIVFIESAPLIDGLLRQGICSGAPRLTGPGVELIRSLHLKLDFQLFHEPDRAREARDRARFRQDLDLLPRAFPHLQRLQLVFHADMYLQRLPAPMNNVPELDAVVFVPLMEFKAKMGLKEFSVALPHFVFINLMELVPEWRTGEIINRRKKELGLFGIQVWYPFESMQDKQGQTGTGRGFPLKIGDYGRYIWDADGSHRYAVLSP